MGDNHPVKSSRFPALTLATLLLTLTVVFFPALFFGRVVSPMDAVESRLPWRNIDRPIEVANPELEDPAVRLLPLAATARRGTGAATWNPFIACGTTGFLTWNDGLLAPSTALLLPWVDGIDLPGGMILLKLLLAFWGTWLLVRSEGAGEIAALTGASAYALAVPLAARWLWPSSASAAALPFLLWAVAACIRSPHPWRRGLVAALAWLAFLAGGDPAVTVGGLYLLAAWVLLVGLRHRASLRQGLLPPAAAALAAGSLLVPSFGLYLLSAGGGDAAAASVPRVGLGLAGLRLLANPFALGDPRLGTFTPPPGLEGLQLHNLAIGAGSVALALALLGLASRRANTIFWGAVAAAGLAPVLWSPAARVFGMLPGLHHAAAWQTAAVPALAIAMLAAAGTEALGSLVRSPALGKWAALLAVAVVLQEGGTAGHLLTWLDPAQAVLRETPAIRYLRDEVGPSPWRIAPLGNVLLPDTAQCFALEDLRSSRRALPAYVRLLRTIDPQSSGHYGTGLRLNPATADLSHPYLRALGARYVLEDPAFHLVEFSLGQQTLEIEPRNATLGPLRPGSRAAVVQELRLPPHTSRLALNATSRGRRVRGTLEVELHDEILDQPVTRWTIDAGALAIDGFRWLDLPAHVADGHRMRLTIRQGLKAGRLWLLRTANPRALDGPLHWGSRPVRGDLGLSFDTSGYVQVADGPDLRIWENRRAAQRFWIVRKVVPGDLETLLRANPPLDLQAVAVVDRPAAKRLAPALHRAGAGATERLTLERATPARYELEARLAAPALLVGSIPAHPPLWHAEIDGRPAELVPADGLFLGLPLPAGRHRVTLHAGLPGSWRFLSAMGLLALIGLAAVARITKDEETP